MHIPDGLLSTPACVATAATSIGALGWSCFQLARQPIAVDAKRIGLVAGGVLAVQTLNVPLLYGSSGHLLGAAAAGALLGPWAGMLAVASVLVVQCLLFADGGTTALGANILNMAVVGAPLGYYFSRLAGAGGRIRAAGVGLAAAFSVALGAAMCAAEAAASGTVGFSQMLAAMFPAHGILAIGEGTLTAVLVALLYRTDATENRATENRSLAGHDLGWIESSVSSRSPNGWLVFGLLLAAFAPLASSLPDTLEYALEVAGFQTSATSAPTRSAPTALLADWTGAWGSLAAMLGAAAALVVAASFARLLGAGRRSFDFKARN